VRAGSTTCCNAALVVQHAATQRSPVGPSPKRRLRANLGFVCFSAPCG
jgi:hypothetical protein